MSQDFNTKKEESPYKETTVNEVIYGKQDSPNMNDYEIDKMKEEIQSMRFVVNQYRNLKKTPEKPE